MMIELNEFRDSMEKEMPYVETSSSNNENSSSSSSGWISVGGARESKYSMEPAWGENNETKYDNKFLQSSEDSQFPADFAISSTLGRNNVKNGNVTVTIPAMFQNQNPRKKRKPNNW